MKKVILIVLSLLLVSGIVFAKDYEVTKKAGEYTVVVRIDRNPPIVGDNKVDIEITDASGHHIRDAKVVVEYSMPAMPGMPPMNYKTDAALKENEYKAKMSLSMSGSWNIAVKITREGRTSTAKFTVDAK
ncbi:MAG: FixH family protein [bacterium]